MEGAPCPRSASTPLPARYGSCVTFPQHTPPGRGRKGFRPREECSATARFVLRAERSLRNGMETERLREVRGRRSVAEDERHRRLARRLADAETAVEPGRSEIDERD